MRLIDVIMSLLKVPKSPILALTLILVGSSLESAEHLSFQVEKNMCFTVCKDWGYSPYLFKNSQGLM